MWFQLVGRFKIIRVGIDRQAGSMAVGFFVFFVGCVFLLRNKAKKVG